MPQVRSALGAADFGAMHVKTCVFMERYGVFLYTVPKTRPAGAGIKLGVRGEKRRATRDAMVHAILSHVNVLPGKRRLGPAFATDVELLRGQFLPKRVLILDLLRHIAIIS